ncbi:hypothetical protein AVEN_39063-1 [Araneus ventricosus]|uniref:Uncharacterized protein n=1 Tax=Araneus ventricosus TaxID=182803 RepID=A0A4Y2PB73_ARAVE|nr:hypothetical protein AVEN_39063-1 [Araneus ventricosus]
MEILQLIPADKLTDLTSSRFGDSHLAQFYRTELKTKLQQTGESPQLLAAGVELLMSLAYAECPLDVRESLAAQYFVDAIRDEDTQNSIRLMDAQDLKSALAYGMKYISLIELFPRPSDTSDQSRRRMIRVEKEMNLNYS